MPSQKELDNFEVEDLGEVVASMLSIPTVYRVWRNSYLDCDDESVLEDVDEVCINYPFKSVREDLPVEVEGYTWIVLRNQIFENRARRQKWVTDLTTEFNAEWEQQQQAKNG